MEQCREKTALDLLMADKIVSLHCLFNDSFTFVDVDLFNKHANRCLTHLLMAL